MQLRQQGVLWAAQVRRMRGLDSAALWLTVWFAFLSVLRLLPGTAGTLAAVLQVLVGLTLVVVAIPVVWRQVRRKLLWSLRNKLVLTYLLIGLAPVVLFATLVLLLAYVAAGQFAIHLADTRLESYLDEVKGLNSLDAWTIEPQLRALGSASAPAGLATMHIVEPVLKGPDGALLPRMTLFFKGLPIANGSQTQSQTRRPLGLPPWATRLESNRFRGMVLDGGELYLVGIEQIEVTPGERYSVVSSLAIDSTLMRTVAHDLGRVRLIAVLTGDDAVEGSSSGAPAAVQTKVARTGMKARQTRALRAPNPEQIRQGSVIGGSEPEAGNVLDLRVRFLSTIPVVNWDTGETDNIPIEVVSRPSRLYRGLFGASLGGRVTRALWIGLAVLIVLFAAIEAVALWMATRLSRTITASVTALYEATQRIDHGEFGYRIGITQDDQLGDLSRSFNSMTGSLQRLLMEQKEKERLQNEISIAQEVQANLFPLKVSDLPTLELHGVCRPARSVSGDYYDFLVFEQERPAGDGHDVITGVGIALGDISGKGISAALLMATLHSAVRAYRLASEELVPATANGAAMFSHSEQAGCSELFESPGRILALLNRHLYRSTQPEKYATLFLAHYDAASSRMTYANAGQLPPLVLSRDGAVRRLDRGGTVVGLLDGMEYEEDSFQMRPGDIVVAYSDGVTEPENDFGDFGEERLMEVVQRYRDEPLHVISSEVMQALDAWIGAEEQPDDITLVLARQI